MNLRNTSRKHLWLTDCLRKNLISGGVNFSKRNETDEIEIESDEGNGINENYQFPTVIGKSEKTQRIFTHCFNH